MTKVSELRIFDIKNYLRTPEDVYGYLKVVLLDEGEDALLQAVKDLIGDIEWGDE